MDELITVGYDGTAPSAEAVRWAADEASARNARLRVVSCYELTTGDAYGFATGAAIESLIAAANENVETIRDEVVRSHPNLRLTPESAPGPAWMTLVEGLGPEDLVVVGASGHRGAAGFWLGSTPRQLVRHSPCPVVVVRGPASRGKPDRIVVGVDGSETSLAAVRWAAAEADLHRVGLLVVHSWWYPYLGIGVDEGASQARDLIQVDAARVLDAAVELARELCGGDVTGALVAEATAAALLDSVVDGDVLVLGSRGRGAIRSGVFGSTVNAVLEHSVVPTVVIPHVAAD